MIVITDNPDSFYALSSLCNIFFGIEKPNFYISICHFGK